MNLILIIAGGIFLTSPKPVTDGLYDHTLKGEPVPATDVVCWNHWGTPMLPDGKGGYSLIAPINQEHIDMSLKQPPRPSDMRAYRPEVTVFTQPTTQVLPAPLAPPVVAPVIIAPVAPAPAPAPVAP